MFMRYLNVAILASTAFSQYAPESANSNDMARQLTGDFLVEAYICLDDNSEVGSPGVLTQGSFLRVCIKIDDTDVTDNIIVEDILTFVVSQPDSTATDSDAITNAVADPLTEKVCRESGICNVKTQLLSKFFTETTPTDLRVEGVAILAFGKASLMPSSAPTAAPAVARRLRAPIRGLLSGDDVKAFMAAHQKNLDDKNKDESGVSAVAGSSQRMLQDAAAQSEFALEVSLQGINGDSGGQGSRSGGGSTIVVSAIVLTVLLAGCCLGFMGCTRRNRKVKEAPKVMLDHHSNNASVGTSPSETSVYSSSSSQHVSHLPSRRTTTTTTETSRTFSWFRYEKKPQGGDNSIVDQHRSNASVCTDPGQASVYSSSSSQHVSHRARDCEQID
jgi:hypothetical protein